MSADVAEWLQHAAAGITRRLDSEDVTIDGEDWYAEQLVRDDEDTADQLLLTHNVHRSARVRVRVELIEGAPA